MVKTEIITDKQKWANTKHSAFVAFALIVGVVIILFVASSRYASVRENLLLHGELSAMQSAEELEECLSVGKNSLIITAHVVDYMLKTGVPSEEILRYMTEESDRIKRTVDDSYTIYGCIGGEYLDGGRWIPDADYIPKERPWYIGAVAAGANQIVFVQPFLNMETKTVMITVAQCLSDGESVIALDFALDDLKELTRVLAETIPGSVAFVLDQTGGVVAHSDQSQTGLHYLEMPDTLGYMVANRILKNGETHFDAEFNGDTYVVYSRALDGGWHSVSIINAEVFYRPLTRVLVIAIAVFILATALITLAFIGVIRRNRAMLNLNTQLTSIAEIYESVYDIDLKRDTIREINDHEKLESTLPGGEGRARASMEMGLSRIVSESSSALMREFLELSTLPERLGNRKSITVEFLDSNGRWCRSRFIEAGRDPDGTLSRVIWATESIDEEKRTRDRLVYLSETDSLTGICNRAGGERRIREELEKGVGGMFILLDIDSFKSFNDRFGHITGDRVLIAVANGLRSAFRTGDVVLRLGGDEFAAFAPNVFTPEIGKAILERLFDSLRSVDIPEMGGERIFLSVGAVFCAPDASTGFQTLYEQADQRTYESKKTEGNQITF